MALCMEGAGAGPQLSARVLSWSGAFVPAGFQILPENWGRCLLFGVLPGFLAHREPLPSKMTSFICREPKATLKTKVMSIHMSQPHPVWLPGTQHQPLLPSGLLTCQRHLPSPGHILCPPGPHSLLSCSFQDLIRNAKSYSFSHRRQ